MCQALCKVFYMHCHLILFSFYFDNKPNEVRASIINCTLQIRKGRLKEIKHVVKGMVAGSPDWDPNWPTFPS